MVTIKEEASILASPLHLEQLISNIIVNALSYSATANPVLIDIQKDSILISDSGNGIPKDVLERLGEPFNRGVSGKTNIKGHGLGLAWVNSVCRLYSWSLVINSKEMGTDIVIKFPPQTEVVESNEATL